MRKGDDLTTFIVTKVEKIRSLNLPEPQEPAQACRGKISPSPSPLQIVIDQKQLENVKHFNYLGSMIANETRCVRETKSRNAMEKAELNRKKALLTSKRDLHLRKKLVKCYMWNTSLYGAETWTLRKIDQKYRRSFEMCCWRRMEKISWTDRVRNEEVLCRVKEERNIIHAVKKGRLTGLVKSCVEIVF